MVHYLAYVMYFSILGLFLEFLYFLPFGMAYICMTGIALNKHYKHVCENERGVVIP